jgi:hypothetical protein
MKIDTRFGKRTIDGFVCNPNGSKAEKTEGYHRGGEYGE